MTKKKIVSDPPAPAETTHPFHPGHKLRLVAGDDVEFECDGCKEPGAGARYTCEHHHHDDAGSEADERRCDFDLHTCCALAPDVLEHHTMFEGHKFLLLHEPPPPDPEPRRVCDACGDEVRGFVYHCFDDDPADGGLDLHPSCARLPARILLDGLAFDLRRGNKKQQPSSSRRRRSCAVCAGDGRPCCRSKFLSYYAVLDGEAVFLHVACVKEMVNESLKAPDHRGGAGGAGKMVRVKAPVLEGILQKRAKKSSKRSKRFLKIVGILIRVIVGMIFGDPTAMIAAVVGVAFSNG